MSFVTIQINTALKLSEYLKDAQEGFVTIQINTALKRKRVDRYRITSFVTIQINTALKLLLEGSVHIPCFVTIQINTALKPRRRFRNRAAHLSQTTDLNDFLTVYNSLSIIKSSSKTN